MIVEGTSINLLRTPNTSLGGWEGFLRSVRLVFRSLSTIKRGALYFALQLLR